MASSWCEPRHKASSLGWHFAQAGPPTKRAGPAARSPPEAPAWGVTGCAIHQATSPIAAAPPTTAAPKALLLIGAVIAGGVARRRIEGSRLGEEASDALLISPRRNHSCLRPGRLGPVARGGGKARVPRGAESGGRGRLPWHEGGRSLPVAGESGRPGYRTPGASRERPPPLPSGGAPPGSPHKEAPTAPAPPPAPP